MRLETWTSQLPSLSLGDLELGQLMLLAYVNPELRRQFGVEWCTVGVNEGTS